jgi:2-succinyl-5-enolpyruvyl-6-hydroxy-3-cyclohexene-1-carboxylate synthase
MLNPFFYNIAEIAAQLELKRIVFSPGSRCAPLTIAFNRHPEISTRTISDERSAAYIGLGMALEKKEPVGLVCTSGTAAANYLPAVTEAFYQHVPLILFTADRPPEWIDQQDGQAIRQFQLYQTHIKKSFQLPVELDHPDAQWHFTRIIAEAINLSKSFPAGPVHINVPLREPFYPQKNERISFSSKLNIRRYTSIKNRQLYLPDDLTEELSKTKKILIVGGQQPFDADMTEVLSQLSAKNIPVIGDIISNLHGVHEVIAHPDNFLGHFLDSEELKPDLVISFGNSVISKNLKLFLRKNKPEFHWHVQESGAVADPMQSITRVINISPLPLLNALNNEIKNISASFKPLWFKNEKKADQVIQKFFEDVEYGEFQIVKKFLSILPAQANLHLANSMSIRYANFIGLRDNKGIEAFSNRGTSGIDGSSSTAVGVAMANPYKENFLLTGDMAFLYDRNAFWHNYKLENLKILVLNNHGGGIFRMIDGPGQLPELEELFETQQKSTAEHLAKEFNIRYINSKGNPTELDEFKKYEGSVIFEYESSGESNHGLFIKFKNQLKQAFAHYEST